MVFNQWRSLASAHGRTPLACAFADASVSMRSGNRVLSVTLIGRGAGACGRRTQPLLTPSWCVRIWRRLSRHLLFGNRRCYSQLCFWQRFCSGVANIRYSSRLALAIQRIS